MALVSTRTSFSLQIETKPIKRLSRGQIFPFKRRKSLVRQPRLDTRPLARQKTQGQGKLLDVNTPIASAFKNTSQSRDNGKNGMPLPTPHDLANLGPRVRVKDVMPCQTNSLGMQESPEIDKICSNKTKVGRQIPWFSASQAILTLIDSYHEMIWKLPSQSQRAPTHTAGRIQN